MSELLALQRRIHAALRDPAQGLDDLGPEAARGLAVHRATIAAGLAQTIANAFPAVRQVVGRPTFTTAVLNYIAEGPPRHPLLSVYGRGFPDFLAAQPISASLPYLPDLARLEWARQESYLAADAPALDTSLLDTADADAIFALALRIHPAARIIGSRFPIHRIWRLAQPDSDATDVPGVEMNAAEQVVITRPRVQVVTRAVSRADATFLRAIRSGARLGSAVEAAFAVTPSFDVMQVLAGHFANGTFAAA